MLRLRCIGPALLLISWLVGCARHPLGTPPGSQPKAGSFNTLRQVPIGLCEDYPEEARSLAEVRRDLATLRAAGVDVLRVSIGWDGVEPEKDRYDFEFWDGFVELAGQQGIRLIPYVAYTPRWNSDGGPDDYWKTPPRDLAEFAELMQLLAKRYRGRIHSWELWNEPDNRDYWLGSAVQYAALLQGGSAAVRAADPKLEVVSGGLAGGVEFLRELFAVPGTADAVDVVNLHSYYETWNPNPLETIPDYVDEVSAIVRQYGGKQSIWMAEVGYSNWRSPAALAAPLYAYEHTAEFQATMLVRTLALLFAKPAVSLVAWYELKDPRPTDAMIGDDNNRHLGVAYADYRPKPAFDALSAMNRLFEAGFREVDGALHVTSPGPDVELHGFVTARHTLLLFAWLKTRPLPPAPSNAALAMTLSDTRRERVRVTAPHTARGRPVMLDERGRRLEQPVETHPELGRTELAFDVEGGEVSIVELPIVAK